MRTSPTVGVEERNGMRLHAFVEGEAAVEAALQHDHVDGVEVERVR
ncbi:MAG: hypothetical protein R2748_29990 [Bryobacterales bacterium]